MKRLINKHYYIQSGFISVWVLVLLVVGITAGTFLVQNGVNFLPKAAGKTTACDGQTLSGQSAQSRADFLAVYGDKATEEWVAEHERDLIKYNIPCDNPGGYAPGIGTGSNVIKAPEPGAAADSSLACKVKPQDKLKNFIDAKIVSNLVRFEAIAKGVPNYCVPADLGVGVQQTTTASDGTTGRLMLCSGAPKNPNDKKSLPDLLWRVPDSSGKVLLPATKTPAPDRDTLLAGFKEQLNKARKEIGLEELP